MSDSPADWEHRAVFRDTFLTALDAPAARVAEAAQEIWDMLWPVEAGT